MDGDTTLLPVEFQEFIQYLNENNVRYLLIGGYAVAFHGFQRYTNDIDFWVASDRANAERLVTALTQFGFIGPEITPEFFSGPQSVLHMGRAPMKIEVVTSIDGVNFEECFRKKLFARVEHVEIPIIDLESLLKNKKAANRPKDVIDVHALEYPKRKKAQAAKEKLLKSGRSRKKRKRS